MIKYDVYLAGAMHMRLGKEVLAERAEAKHICRDLGLTYYDPAEDEHIEPEELIDAKPSRRRMSWYVRKDDAHVDQCRALLILTGDGASSGTLWEAGRMFYRNHRPIVAVAPRMCDRFLANFTTIKASKLVRSQRKGLEWLDRHLPFAKSRKLKRARRKTVASTLDGIFKAAYGKKISQFIPISRWK